MGAGIFNSIILLHIPIWSSFFFYLSCTKLIKYFSTWLSFTFWCMKLVVQLGKGKAKSMKCGHLLLHMPWKCEFMSP